MPETNYKILVAEDDREHLLMLTFMLRKNGYQVISAFDAKHALQLAVEQTPDLLLLDIHLGNEESYEIQERLRSIEELANTPVIYLTGDQSDWVLCTTLALGANALIRKPFEKQELLNAIETALSPKKSPEEVVAGAASSPPAMCQATEAFFG
jgi:DNA-binding response OmpR family regulator